MREYVSMYLLLRYYMLLYGLTFTWTASLTPVIPHILSYTEFQAMNYFFDTEISHKVGANFQIS